MKGVYILNLKLESDSSICIGKLGTLLFKKGYYAYTGSAHGPGGFKRVRRHFTIATNINPARRWHIDYLLPHTKIISAVLMPTDKDIECIVAGKMGALLDEIPGFGCSDCSCTSHLFFAETDMKNTVIGACANLLENESIIIRPHL